MSGVVNVAAVDATENPKLAQKYGVQGYPTIKIFGADKRNPTDYQGQRQTDDIVSGGMAAARKLVKDRHSGKAKKSSGKDSKPKKDSSSGAGGRKSPASDDAVIELTSSNFDSVVLDSDEQFFVEFYAPWCGHCQRLAPEWKEAATELQGVVNFGAVDATEHQDLAQRYGVQGFPTIFIWKAGPKVHF
jgi:protein disulfide-isomerase A6